MHTHFHVTSGRPQVAALCSTDDLVAGVVVVGKDRKDSATVPTSKP